MAGDVLVLEDDDDVRDSMTGLVRLACGRAALGVASVDELMALGAQVLDCELAILDVHLGDELPTGIDAHHWLRGAGFDGRIVFLTAHELDHPLAVTAAALEDVYVRQKPIDVDELREIVAGHQRATGSG